MGAHRICQLSQTKTTQTQVEFLNYRRQDDAGGVVCADGRIEKVGGPHQHRVAFCLQTSAVSGTDTKPKGHEPTFVINELRWAAKILGASSAVASPSVEPHFGLMRP